MDRCMSIEFLNLVVGFLWLAFYAEDSVIGVFSVSVYYNTDVTFMIEIVGSPLYVQKFPLVALCNRNRINSLAAYHILF